MVEAQLLRKFSVGMGLQSDAIEDLKRLKAAGSKLGSIKFSAALCSSSSAIYTSEVELFYKMKLAI